MKSDPFNIHEWAQENLPQAFHARAVKILDKNGMTYEQVKTVYELGRNVQRFEDEFALVEAEAKVAGLTTALSAKGQIEIKLPEFTVNRKDKIFITIIIVVLGILIGYANTLFYFAFTRL